MTDEKLLSIVIPSYRETPQQIHELLNSIAIQINLDFKKIEVLLVRDGDSGGPYPNDVFTYLPFQTQQLIMPENRGPGVARQVGMDHAVGTYIMFCDADDIIHNSFAISALLEKIQRENALMLIGAWVEEAQADSGEMLYVPHIKDTTWMHAKIFHRQTIKDLGIRFHPVYRVHEDIYFVGQALAGIPSDKIIYADDYAYVWRWNKKSITRVNNGRYRFAEFPSFCEINTAARRQIAKFNPDLAARACCYYITLGYFFMHRPEWNVPEHLHYRQESELAIAKHLSDVDVAIITQNKDTDAFAKIYTEQRNDNFTGLTETESFTVWFNHILDLRKKLIQQNTLTAPASKHSSKKKRKH